MKESSATIKLSKSEIEWVIISLVHAKESCEHFSNFENTSMFKRLWKNHGSVEHNEFYFVKDAMSNQIAVRFQVKNILHNGQIVSKSNCNFFTLKDGIFSEVRVYMAGENTLNKEDWRQDFGHKKKHLMSTQNL